MRYISGSETSSVSECSPCCLQIDKPATFTVSFNGASGQLHSYIRSPSGGHEDCFIQEMDTGLYAIRYTVGKLFCTFVHSEMDSKYPAGARKIYVPVGKQNFSNGYGNYTTLSKKINLQTYFVGAVGFQTFNYNI